jgi:hypothetical protein
MLGELKAMGAVNGNETSAIENYLKKNHLSLQAHMPKAFQTKELAALRKSISRQCAPIYIKTFRDRQPKGQNATWPQQSQNALPKKLLAERTRPKQRRL